MTVRRIVDPVYEISCDGGCGEVLSSGDYFSEWVVRYAARLEDWLVRPGRGKGCRTAPDLCPKCRPGSHTPDGETVAP
ncbi:MAG TPA: hypothetical protein VF163_18130 [Micromonosporaceae bacterium]